MSLKVLVINEYTDVQSVRPEAEMLIGLHRNGVQVDVITPTSSYYPQRFKEVGMRVIDAHPKWKLSLSSIRFIRNLLQKEQYDVVYLFNSKAIINTLWAAIGLPVKVVLYRGAARNLHWANPVSYLKHLHPRVDKIICISDETRQYLQNQLISSSKAIRIHKGHDMEWYNDVKPVDLTKELNIPSTAFVAVTVANVRPVKAVPDFINATQYLPADSSIHIILIGKGMQQSNIQQAIEASPLKKQIHVVGFQEDPLSWVTACDAFVLSSTGSEAITKAVIEAMALQVTPVITDIPGNKKLVEHEVSGLKVSPHRPREIARALQYLSDRPSLNKKLGRRAQQHISQNFSLQRTIEETQKFFEELVNKQ